MPKNLYIIDGHAHIYGAYYAPTGQRLVSKTGEPTKASYIFTTTLKSLLDKAEPDMLVVAMDSKAPTFRKEIYDDYKATRPPMPEDLPVQIDRIEQILAAMKIPMLRVDGYEADDIIGTLVREAKSRGVEAFMCSKDKDLLQLLDDGIYMYDIQKDIRTGPAELMEDKGITPAQFADVLALQGDTSDNIPGVPDVGPKTALDWIKQYGSLANLYEHADEIKGKRGTSLRDNKEQAFLSRKLVEINRSVPIDSDFESFARQQPDKEKLAALFSELGFTRLIESMDLKAEGESNAAGAGGAVPDLFTSAKTVEKEYQLIDTLDALEAFAAELKEHRIIAVDTETNSVTAMEADLVGMSFSWRPHQGAYLPVRGPLGRAVLKIDDVRRVIGPILADADIRKIGQNFKYDLLVLHNAGMPVKGVWFDTMVASYVLDPQRRHSLDQMARDYFGYEPIPISTLIGTGRNQVTFDLVDVEAACEYASEDADLTFQIYEILLKQLDAEPELKKLFMEVEMPLVEVLARMEINGVSLDVPLLQEFSNRLHDTLEDLTGQIYDLAGTEFNIDSPKQLAEVLFDRLELPVIRSTKTSRSTDAAVLDQLRGEHEIIVLLIEYRQLVKLKNTYVDKLPQLINPKTDRLHASFNQTVTATGRLSSSDPNLQNIPIRTELGRRIRAAFVPAEKTGCILSADYSQIELRLLAHFSQDPALLEAFRNDRDIHSFVASQIYGVPLDAVTSEMRSACKAVNFGIIYGQGPFGLSKTIGITQSQAKDFIAQYFARYGSIRTFMDSIIEDAKKTGYARTMLGRRRPITGLSSRNFNRRSQAERMAVNTTIQGSAADLIKLAMIAIERKIEAEDLPVLMTLQIHDELVFELPAAQADQHKQWIVHEMTHAMDLDVPLKVDVAAGPSWLEEKE